MAGELSIVVDQDEELRVADILSFNAACVIVSMPRVPESRRWRLGGLIASLAGGPAEGYEE